jgi:hypothetical protein
MATSHVQYFAYASSPGEGLAFGVNAAQSSFEITGSNHNAFFRGNVGIGTATPASKLEIYQSSNDNTHNIGLKSWTGNSMNYFGNTQFQLAYGGGGGSFAHAIKSRHNSSGINGNAIDFYLWQPGDNVNGEGSLNVMTLNGTNVGIGTASPGQKLEVAGNAFVNTDNSAFVIDTQPNARLGFLKKSGNGPVIASDSGNPIVFSQSNQAGLFTNIAGATMTEFMRIAGNGYVGIGTSTPAYKLDVNGSINASAILINGAPFAGGGSQWTTSGTSIYYGAGGNVGIGTTSPANRLHIYESSANALGKVETGGANTAALIFKNTTDEWQIGNQTGGFAGFNFGTASGVKMTIQSSGKVGIGTTSPDATLAVKGQVHAQEVKVDLQGAVAPDYVFESSYKLLSLQEVKDYITANKHLPEVPSAKEIEKNGVQLGEMNLLLLKKIEELTLYILEQEKRIKALETGVKEK